MDHIRYFTSQQQSQTTQDVQEGHPVTPKTLQNGVLAIKNSSNLRLDVSKEDVRLSPRLSPISPRPWYKRPVSGSREPSAIPFKREVILRTVDKRRKKKHVTGEEQQPEVGFMRSSRFAIFSRNKEAKKVETTEEVKRRSGIGMPNISELDREAQQIIRNQRITLTTDDVVLRQRDLISDSEEEEEQEQEANVNGFHPRRRRKSAKELISRFESKNPNKMNSRATAPGNVTANSSNQSNSEPPTQVIHDSPPSASSDVAVAASPPPPSVATKNTVIQPDVVKLVAADKDNNHHQQKSVKDLQSLWKCPYCTLENPNWRILCEVCERIKPYESKSGAGLIPIGIVVAGNKNQPEPEAERLTIDNESLDKKVDKVKQYFPQNCLSGSTLVKSASETSVGGNLMTSNKFKKTSIESPNFNEIRSVVHKMSNSELRSNFHNEVVVNSVTVIHDPGPGGASTKERKKTNLNGTPDLEEVRHARLNHFKPVQGQPQLPQSRDSIAPVMITDKDSLDRERERLKEKIRAMNAKALAERYPVIVKKQVSVEETYDTVYPKAVPKPIEEVQRRMSPDRSAGAIKKCFNKSPQVEKIVNGPESRDFMNESAKETLKGIDQEKDMKQVKELAEQLQSLQGREDFKATLKFSEKTGTIAINKLIKSLETAIMDGQDEMAAKLAKDLAKMKVSLSVTRQRKEERVQDQEDPKLIK